MERPAPTAEPGRAHLAGTPSVSAVIVTYRRPDLLAECLRSVDRALLVVGEETELVVVDNGSNDGTSEFVRRQFRGAVLVHLPTNVGFTRAVAEGIRRASGEWVLLVNDDVVVEPDAVRHLLATGRTSPNVGSVAAQMRFADRPDVINSAGIEVDRLGVATDRLVGASVESSETEPVEVFGVSGGAALYRRRMLDEIGGFDESFFAYLEDVDVAWRARMRGWRALYCPTAIAYHHHSATLVHGSPLKYFLVGRNRIRLLAKNAHPGHLWRYGLAIAAYEVAYVAFVVLSDRTLAPLRGRIQGVREWRRYRNEGAPERRPVRLAKSAGVRGALRRRRAWQGKRLAS